MVPREYRRRSRRSSQGSIEFLAQNVRTADFDDPVFKPYVLREVNGIPVAIIGQAFPYTPIANPRYFVAGLDVRHSGRASPARRGRSTRAKVRGPLCCCRTMAWMWI